MKKNRLLQLVLLLGFGLIFSVHAEEPNIEFEETVYDFGKVRSEEIVTHTYILRNTGAKSLTISKVNACCGVRASLVPKAGRWPPEVIPPGEEGEVRVTYYRTSGEGSRSKTIRIHSDDPDEPIVELKLKGVIQPPPVSVNPGEVWFGDVAQGEEVSKELRVLGTEAGELKSVSVESSTPYLATHVSEITEGKESGFIVNVVLSPEAPAGQLRERLEVKTHIEGYRSIEVPVYAQITGEPTATRLAGGPAPDIELLAKSHDFGMVKEGDVATHMFKFRNIGSEPLVVSEVSACCGVTASLLSGDVTPPDGEGEVELTCEFRGKEGRKGRVVRIHSNDPDEPIVELRLTYIVEAPLSVTPNRLIFDKVPRGEERQGELRVLQVGKKGLRVESSADWLLAEVAGRDVPPTSSEPEEGEGECRVQVTLTPEAPSGELRELLTLTAGGGEGERAAEVPVLGKVLGRMSVVPSRCPFRGVSEGDSLTRRLSVSCKEEFKVLKVESDLEFVSALVARPEEGQAKEGQTYEIILIVKVDDLSAVRNGKVLIHTDDPEDPVIQVPIEFYRLRQSR